MLACSIEGCLKPSRCRGWCDKHYTRWRRHGDPLSAIRPFDISIEERFWSKVEKTDGCWLWTAGCDQNGYGVFALPRSASPRKRQAHRFAYELLVGPIPDGLELDHVRARGCTHRNCVRPDHLEPVTHAENVRRGNGPLHNAAKTHCPQGHEYTPENTYMRPGRPSRKCRECGRIATRRWAHSAGRRATVSAAKPGSVQT